MKVFKAAITETKGWWEAQVTKPNGRPSKVTHTHLNAATFAVRETFGMFIEAFSFQYQVRGIWQPDSFKANLSTRGRKPLIAPELEVGHKIQKLRDNFRQDRTKVINALRQHPFIRKRTADQKFSLFKKIFEIFNEAIREALSVDHGITMRKHGKEHKLFIGKDYDIVADFKDAKGENMLEDSNELGRADIWTVKDTSTTPKVRKAKQPVARRKIKAEEDFSTALLRL